MNNDYLDNILKEVKEDSVSSVDNNLAAQDPLGFCIECDNCKYREVNCSIMASRMKSNRRKRLTV